VQQIACQESCRIADIKDAVADGDSDFLSTFGSAWAADCRIHEFQYSTVVTETVMGNCKISD